MNKTSINCCFFDDSAWDYKDTEEKLSTSARLLVSQHLKLSENKDNFLDVCCGQGLISKILQEHSVKNISCVDGSRNMLEYYTDNLGTFVQKENIYFHDFEFGPFDPKKKFDNIIINAGIQYISKIGDFIENMHHLSEKNAVLSFSYINNDWNEDTIQDEYGEFYSRGYYEKLIKFYFREENIFFKEVLSKKFEILNISNYQQTPKHTTTRLLTARKK